jgi:S-adenosylmethionine/arginine decarboxylase-like enzyme
MMYHKHLIIRAEVDNLPEGEDFINNWLLSILKKIKMDVLFGPKAIYCDLVGNAGWTAFVILTTSHSVLHTWHENDLNMIQFDLYSCGDFEVADIVPFFTNFGIRTIEFKFLDRENGLTEIQTPSMAIARAVNF